jgi:TPR repeat protein
LYESGEGVPQNSTEAVKWYRKAAEQGAPNAQNNLAYMYYIGNGVAQSYTEALKWISKAAEQGFAPAQNGLGAMLRDGQGVRQNDQNDIEAVAWFRKAAEQDNADAKYNLNDMVYVRRRGVVSANKGYSSESDRYDPLEQWNKDRMDDWNQQLLFGQ